MTKSSGNVSPRSPVAAALLKSSAPNPFSKSNYRHSVPLKFFQDDKRPSDASGFVSANITFFQEKSGTSKPLPSLFFKTKLQKVQEGEGDSKRNWGYSPYAGNAVAIKTPDCSYMDGRNSPRIRKSSVPVTDLRKVFVYDSNGKAIQLKVPYEATDIIPCESYDDTGYNAISCYSDDLYSSDHDANSDDEDAAISMSDPLKSMVRLGEKKRAIVVSTGEEDEQNIITSEKVDRSTPLCSQKSMGAPQSKDPPAGNARPCFPSAHSSPPTPLAEALSSFFSAPFPNAVTPDTSSESSGSPLPLPLMRGDLQTDSDLYEIMMACIDPQRSTASMISAEGSPNRRRSVREIVNSWGLQRRSLTH